MAENPDKDDEYLELLVDVQMEIHSKKSPLLTKLKDKMHRKISSSTIDATTRYELHTRLEGMPKHNKVCHGDLWPSNIIITNDGTPYVIDWAHATQGNASEDVARTYLLFCLNGDKETAEKSQAAQQTQMMMWMFPIMSLWIGFSVPSALSLYWLIGGISRMVEDLVLTKHYRKVYDAEDAERLKRHLEEEAAEAEKERLRAEKRAANPEGITENTSKKKL
jgi:thiamine kinase-like enzyme